MSEKGVLGASGEGYPTVFGVRGSDYRPLPVSLYPDNHGSAVEAQVQAIASPVAETSDPGLAYQPMLVCHTWSRTLVDKHASFILRSMCLGERTYIGRLRSKAPTAVLRTGCGRGSHYRLWQARAQSPMTRRNPRWNGRLKRIRVPFDA